MYEVRRVDTVNFHGWVIFECSDFFEEEYFSSESYDEIKQVMRDLGA